MKVERQLVVAKWNLAIDILIIDNLLRKLFKLAQQFYISTLCSCAFSHPFNANFTHANLR